LKNVVKMTNELLASFSGNMFPRGAGNPYRRNSFGEYYILNSVEDMEAFVKMCDETNCYMTVYSYTEYTQTNRDKYSAVISTIPFDFDDKESLVDAFNDMKKLLAWCKRHDIQPRVQFSGSKGFHLFIDLKPVKLNHPQEVLRKFVYELNKAASLDSLDMMVIGDLERIIRIPNTIHKSSGKYCIPLNPKFIPFLKIEDIQALARNKSDYVPVRCEHDGEVRTLLEEYDEIVEVEIEEMKQRLEAGKVKEQNSKFPGLSVGVPCLAFRDCMENGAEEGIRDHCLVGCICKLKSDGFTKDYIFRKLMEFSGRCTPSLNESYVRTRLNSHWNKNYSFCTFFSKVSATCSVCPNKKF